MSNFFRELSRGRLGGHPIHIMLVHFPIALWPAALVMDTLAWAQGSGEMARNAWHCMLGGTGLGWLALVFGGMDLLKIRPDSVAMTRALWHGGLQFVWVSFYTVLVLLLWRNYPDLPIPTPLRLISEVVVVLGVFLASYLGGDLIFRHRIGIDHKEPGD